MTTFTIHSVGDTIESKCEDICRKDLKVFNVFKAGELLTVLEYKPFYKCKVAFDGIYVKGEISMHETWLTCDLRGSNDCSTQKCEQNVPPLF